MSEPLLSIVIANYNYGRFLEDAIQSVVAQGSGDLVELIVCDAASTDNSVEIIKKYANGLPPNTSYDDWAPQNESKWGKQLLRWWCSEKDGGQSAAFNKGFANAKGRFLTWLNADDILLPGTIDALKKAHEKDPKCSWYTGNFLQFRQDTKKIILAPWGPHVVPRFLQTFDSPLVIFGPTTFWGRDAYERVGAMNERLHYSMDTEYWLRMKKARFYLRRLNHCCWAFRMHDLSKTAQYEGRVISKEVEANWYSELNSIKDNVGYKCSVISRVLSLVFRVFDGSMFVALWRRLFVVGRKLEVCLEK